MKIVLASCLLFALPVVLCARTITLTAEDCDQAAVIAASLPRSSWAAMKRASGILDTGPSVHLSADMAILMRFSLDKIPKDQRIIRAELTTATNYNPVPVKIQVRRLLADWGPGVCHIYRRTFPKKIEWSQGGGRGAGSDRTNKASGVMSFKGPSEATVDLTEDVELWYTGGATNLGWIFNIEGSAGVIYLASPYCPSSPSAQQWKLVITFEPR